MAAITGWTVDDWPFSMAKFLDFYTIIFKEDGSNNIDLYEAYCGTDDVWVATQCIDSMAVINAPTRYPINIDFADFGWFYAMAYAEISSGTLQAQCYMRDPDIASGLTSLEALPTSKCPDFVTCCNFNGQGILGGIISTDASWTQLGRCSVAWSVIGQWEFRPSVNRTAGYLRMPWSDWDEGVVHKVAKLGDMVMVYGNGGRAALRPFNTPLANGFGLVPLSGPGIDKGFHFAGDSSTHCILDTNNEVWVVTPGPKFSRLGYKEWFDDLIAENVAQAVGLPLVMSYDHTNKRFYFGGFSSSYVLTEYGLYSTGQSCTSVGNYRGNVLSGFFKDLSDDEGRVKLDDIDFGQRGLKTVDHLEMGITYDPSGAETITAGVDTKYDNDETHRTGSWLRVNSQGMVYLGKTAADFRIKAKVSDYSDGDPKLDSMKIRWKMVDKRSIRGMYDAG